MVEIIVSPVALKAGGNQRITDAGTLVDLMLLTPAVKGK